MKPQDTKASQVHFGVELETVVPNSAGVVIGSYHRGSTVYGARTLYGGDVLAPNFLGNHWKAERDGSIRTNSGQQACEFVSPILHGEDGVRALGDFVGFINSIGGKVNESCGCHITVSVDSITGSTDPNVRAEFARKLAHIAQWHARAIYGQTGSGRHLNHYSHAFSEDVARWVKQMTTASDAMVKHRAATNCGRGMVNFRKLFTHGVVEFRAFAGTTNLLKIQHHVATAIGLCRRAHEVQCLGAFKKNKLQQKRTATAVDAVQFLWDYLGWTGSKRPVALGLFGDLHRNFRSHSDAALQLCRKFDQRFPTASL
jgi:hypothetical protein